jgi:hypothetical protein
MSSGRTTLRSSVIAIFLQLVDGLLSLPDILGGLASTLSFH